MANIMRLSLMKGAYAALSNAAWQEIQVASAEMTILFGNATFRFQASLSSRPKKSRQLPGIGTGQFSGMGYFSLVGGTNPFKRRYNDRIAYCSLS